MTAEQLQLLQQQLATTGQLPVLPLVLPLAGQLDRGGGGMTDSSDTNTLQVIF